MDLVADRMSSPPRTAPPSTPLPALVQLLEQAKISALPIVEEGRLLGVVSTTDLVRAKAQGQLHQGLSAADCMSREVRTVRADANLREAAQGLVAARVHRLVVVDAHGAPLGVLSTRDLLKDVAQQRSLQPIAEIMTPDPVCVDVGCPIDEGIARLAESNVHGLVVTEGLRPVGVFTHTEALAARSLPPSLREQPIESVMSYETLCFDVQTPVHRAAAHAMSMNVRRLLVVQHRDVVGILSCLDLVRTLAE